MWVFILDDYCLSLHFHLFFIPAFFKGLLEELLCNIPSRIVSQKGSYAESRKSWPWGLGTIVQLILMLRY